MIGYLIVIILCVAFWNAGYAGHRLFPWWLAYLGFVGLLFAVMAILFSTPRTVPYASFAVMASAWFIPCLVAFYAGRWWSRHQGRASIELRAKAFNPGQAEDWMEGADLARLEENLKASTVSSKAPRP